jgi:hypothetical protein
MSEPSISETDGADMDGRVEQAIRFRANQFAAGAPSLAQAGRHPEQTTDGSPRDLSGRVLSRLESQFADLFRGGRP